MVQPATTGYHFGIKASSRLLVGIIGRSPSGENWSVKNDNMVEHESID
jgi:hypothetical protein